MQKKTRYYCRNLEHTNGKMEKKNVIRNLGDTNRKMEKKNL